MDNSVELGSAGVDEHPKTCQLVVGADGNHPGPDQENQVGIGVDDKTPAGLLDGKDHGPRASPDLGFSQTHTGEWPFPVDQKLFDLELDGAPSVHQVDEIG